MKKKLILIADDEPAIREILKEYLEESKYDVIEATNGEQALKLAAEKRPALILMDAKMPILDGFSATMKLKEDPKIKDIPIVSVTSLVEIDSALACGADACLQKPFNSKQLEKTLSKFLD